VVCCGVVCGVLLDNHYTRRRSSEKIRPRSLPALRVGWEKSGRPSLLLASLREIEQDKSNAAHSTTMQVNTRHDKWLKCTLIMYNKSIIKDKRKQAICKCTSLERSTVSTNETFRLLLGLVSAWAWLWAGYCERGRRG
jgi:hypothetical protein